MITSPGAQALLPERSRPEGALRLRGASLAERCRLGCAPFTLNTLGLQQAPVHVTPPPFPEGLPVPGLELGVSICDCIVSQPPASLVIDEAEAGAP